MLKEEFLNRLTVILDNRNVGAMSDDLLIELMGLTQYATDLLLNEAEARGLLGDDEGRILVPCILPDGVEMIETILTRKVANAA